MQTLAKTFRTALGVIGALGFLSGCAFNMKVPVKDPAPSSVKYGAVQTSAPVMLVFKDELTAAGRQNILEGSLLPMNLEYEGKPFEPVPWLAKQTVNELNARGFPATLGSVGTNGTAVRIKHLHIQNYRASAYSPFVTFTSVRAEVDMPRGPQRITAYIKRGKVPVWSFDEVVDPTYNDALSLLTKELAAKLNHHLFGQIVGNDQVKALIAAIDKDGATRPDAYLDVYQLGFSNNPNAVPALVKLTSHSSEYIRLAAFSSLGILKATDQFSFLVSRYESKTGVWQDRAMALKAIGDLGTVESRAYLQKERAAMEKLTDKESTWNKEIIALYLSAS